MGANESLRVSHVRLHWLRALKEQSVPPPLSSPLASLPLPPYAAAEFLAMAN